MRKDEMKTFCKLVVAILFYFSTTINFVYQCGEITSENDSSNRIINGTPAETGEFPFWIRLLVHRVNKKGERVVEHCGGSMISGNVVLTAAHCLYDDSKREYVTADSVDVIAAWKDPKHQPLKFTSSKIIPHENFKLNSRHDIALIKTKQSFQSNDYFRPICMPFKKVPGYGRTLAMGAGVTENMTLADKIMKINLYLMPLSRCRFIYKDIGFKGTLHDEFFCAYTPGQDTCAGDSGGPLLKIEHGKYYQIGIVAFGVGCARPGIPGVYTDVYKHRDWIAFHMYNSQREDVGKKAIDTTTGPSVQEKLLNENVHGKVLMVEGQSCDNATSGGGGNNASATDGVCDGRDQKVNGSNEISYLTISTMTFCLWLRFP